jgi:hypothetical protein
MFWRYVIYVVLFSAGNIFSSVSVIVPMICVNFAIPATRKLTDAGWFTNEAAVRKRNRMPIVVWGLINAIVFAIFFLFVPMRYMIAFYAGCIWCTLLALGKSGANTSNIQEYMAYALPYSRATTEEEVNEMVKLITRK